MRKALLILGSTVALFSHAQAGCQSVPSHNVPFGIGGFAMVQPHFVEPKAKCVNRKTTSRHHKPHTAHVVVNLAS